MRENEYQAELIQRILTLLPEAQVIITDPNMLQGVPDLLVLHRGRYAFLEVKRSASARLRPNQDWYVKHYAESGAFSSFIFPEIEEEVLNALQQAL